MSTLPTFPYFSDPVAEGMISRSTDTCSCCQLARGWAYKGPVYGAGPRPKSLCPWCIADGAAAARFDCQFNDTGVLGGPGPRGAPPAGLPAGEREIIERRTPGFRTWQGNHWMICCGRACIYLGGAAAEDLTGPWAAAVPSILADVDDWTPERRSELLRAIDKEGDVCAYVFQCRVCQGLRGYFDMS